MSLQALDFKGKSINKTEETFQPKIKADDWPWKQAYGT